MQQLLACLKGKLLLSLRSLEHAKVSTWEEQSVNAEVCSVQIGRGSKGEAVSLQAGIKNIPRGFFFPQVKANNYKEHKKQLQLEKLI